MDRKYEDIVHLPHPVSSRRAPMSNHDRAAQFSPFAALTGLDAAMAETARLTELPVELEEEWKLLVDEKLRQLRQQLHTRPRVVITHFLPDARKSGGAYVCTAGRVRRIEEFSRVIHLTDGRTVSLDAVLNVEISDPE